MEILQTKICWNSTFKSKFRSNYEYEKSKFKAEVVAVDRWINLMIVQKSKEIAGYAVTNLKYTQELFKHLN